MPNINDFKAKLAGGGARANQFKVTMPFPGYAQVGGEIEDLAFLCRATSIPGMEVANINVPFRGRSINFIQLQFVATRTGVAFEEVVGA